MPDINPSNTDAVLGGQNPPPVDAAVLGGEIGRKQRLEYKKTQKLWRNFEYFNDYPDRHAITFAGRQVIDFEPGVKIEDPIHSAYAVRAYEIEEFKLKWNFLLQSDRANEIEALVFSFIDFDDNDINPIVSNACHELNNLKAIFLGDIADCDVMISLIRIDDVSPILLAYDRLDFFQVRCGNYGFYRTGEIRHEGFSFCQPLKHDRLKVLRIESGGLSPRTLHDLNQLDLPNLEYLELWLGNKWYGGTSCINDLMPVISGDKFPKLKYLGFRNCDYTDDIAFELAQSPFLKHLYDLDLSMGTLGDEGLKALLTCPDINELCTLNVSKNYISKNFIEEILPQFKLNCEVIVDNQQCDEYVDRSNRYCVVAE